MELHSKFEKALLDMNTKLIDTKAKNKELTTRLHRLTSNNKSVSRFKIFYFTYIHVEWHCFLCCTCGTCSVDYITGYYM